MKIKNISLLSLLSLFIYVQNNPYEIKNAPLECTGKVVQERQPLFIQAEKQEQIFIAALKECFEQDNCHIHAGFRRARYELLISIIALSKHLEDLDTKNNKTCTVCEKNETKTLKNRLLELLKKY